MGRSGLCRVKEQMCSCWGSSPDGMAASGTEPANQDHLVGTPTYARTAQRLNRAVEGSENPTAVLAQEPGTRLGMGGQRGCTSSYSTRTIHTVRSRSALHNTPPHRRPPVWLHPLTARRLRHAPRACTLTPKAGDGRADGARHSFKRSYGDFVAYTDKGMQTRIDRRHLVRLLAGALLASFVAKGALREARLPLGVVMFQHPSCLPRLRVLMWDSTQPAGVMNTQAVRRPTVHVRRLHEEQYVACRLQGSKAAQGRLLIA